MYKVYDKTRLWHTDRHKKWTTWWPFSLTSLQSIFCVYFHTWGRAICPVSVHPWLGVYVQNGRVDVSYSRYPHRSTPLHPSLQPLSQFAFLVSAAAEAGFHDVVEALPVLAAHVLQAAALQELLLGLLLALLQDLLAALQLWAHTLLASSLLRPPWTVPASTACRDHGSTSVWRHKYNNTAGHAIIHGGRNNMETMFTIVKMLMILWCRTVSGCQWTEIHNQTTIKCIFIRNVSWGTNKWMSILDDGVQSPTYTCNCHVINVLNGISSLSKLCYLFTHHSFQTIKNTKH